MKSGRPEPLRAAGAATVPGGVASATTPSAAFVRKAEDRRGDLAVGAVLGLVTLAMMFAGLLFAYAYLRASQAGSWAPPDGVRLPKLAPALATVSVIAGGAALVCGLGRKKLIIAATTVVTIIFQTLTLFQACGGGLRPSSGSVGSVVFALTALHGLHLVGLLVLVAITLRKRATLDLASGPLIWTSHVLGGFWLAIYLGVYVF